MLNETMTGIARKLNATFGNGYEIYIDEVKQGLKEPCFLLICLTGRQQQEIGPTYNREQAFDLHYFPKAKNYTAEVNGVVDALNMELEYITVDGALIRGSKMKHQVIDGVLHFLVNYDLRIRKVIDPDPVMEDLEIIERVKAIG